MALEPPGIHRFMDGDPRELIFTSGGTESDNTALLGTAWQRLNDAGRQTRGHIITSAVEHHAVLHTCRRLEELGFDVTYLPVDEYGRIRVKDFVAAIRPDTFLASVIYGNNEVGTLQPIVEIGEAASARDYLPHRCSDLACSASIVSALPVDLMSFSAHKINGPKGVGLLYCRRTVHFEPLLYGGSQEKNRRPAQRTSPGSSALRRRWNLPKVNGKNNIRGCGI